MLRKDGTGAIEYFYGKMGEVTKTRRTLIVPNQAIATYVTQWTYDSHNRLLEMIYPDEEKITYSYNLGGQLEKVHGFKSYGYDYVSKIGYDKFEQRTYITEQLQIISHSRGGAFASGYMQSVSAEIRNLANKDNMTFSYANDNNLKYE